MMIGRLAQLSVLVGSLLAVAPSSASPLPGPERWDNGQVELGPRLTHLLLSDQDTDQTLGMGGVGGYLRYRFSRRWGLETALDILGSDELAAQSPGEVTRVTIPLTASGMYYLFPESSVQVYFLVGLGVTGNVVEYKALGESIGFSNALGQLGVGVQYRMDELRLDLSIRSLYLTQNEDDVQREVMAEENTDRKYVTYSPYTGSRDIDGTMINLGVHWGL